MGVVAGVVALAVVEVVAFVGLCLWASKRVEDKTNER